MSKMEQGMSAEGRAEVERCESALSKMIAVSGVSAADFVYFVERPGFTQFGGFCSGPSGLLRVEWVEQGRGHELPSRETAEALRELLGAAGQECWLRSKLRPDAPW